MELEKIATSAFWPSGELEKKCSGEGGFFKKKCKEGKITHHQGSQKHSLQMNGIKYGGKG